LPASAYIFHSDSRIPNGNISYFNRLNDQHLISVKSALKNVFLACLLIAPFLPALPQTVSDRVRDIHHRAFVIDTHTDTPMDLLNPEFNPALRHQAPESRVDFPRLREGDVDAIFFGLFTGQRDRTPEHYDQAYLTANRMLDSTLSVVRRNPETVKIATSPREIRQISRQGKTAICLGMENGFPLAKDLTRVEEFYRKGVRYITLCHSSNNDICDSSTDPDSAEHNGLSSYGRDVVAEMNRLGMIVDVSHISDKSFFDVLKISRAPVIASHSSVRKLCDHPRNMSDDMIRALGAKGGVIQICILDNYIVPADTTSDNYRLHQALRKEYNGFKFNNEAERKAARSAYDSIDENFPTVLPTIAQAVDHIDYVVKLVGVDYVGIGSDFDGGGGLADCPDVAAFPLITAELVKRGYSEADIDKIWGGNFLRVFKAVEKAAR
jgi:membrane dipeptidase